MLVLVLLLVLVAVVATVYAVGLYRAAKAATLAGSPTPEEAKIVEQTKRTARDILERAERERTEVQHANRNELLARLRDRVRGK